MKNKINPFIFYSEAKPILRLIEISASRMKCQISTSESKENACSCFAERDRDSKKLNLFEHFRGEAYIAINRN